MPMDLRRMLRATKSRAKARQLILRAKALTLVPAVISPGRCRLAAMESSLPATPSQARLSRWSGKKWVACLRSRASVKARTASFSRSCGVFLWADAPLRPLASNWPRLGPVPALRRSGRPSREMARHSRTPSFLWPMRLPISRAAPTTSWMGLLMLRCCSPGVSVSALSRASPPRATGFSPRASRTQAVPRHLSAPKCSCSATSRRKSGLTGPESTAPTSRLWCPLAPAASDSQPPPRRASDAAPPGVAVRCNRWMMPRAHSPARLLALPCRCMCSRRRPPGPTRRRTRGWPLWTLSHARSPPRWAEMTRPRSTL